MAKAKEYTCIGCPIGCPLQLVHRGDKITEISGYECDRGAKYAKQEFSDPRRELSTTDEIAGARWKREADIPDDVYFKALEALG